MYIEHPYFYEGKYYANIDGEMIEITKEVAYAMNNFYRSSKAEYSRAMKSHFRKFGNQMSGSGNHLCNYASLLA